MINDEGGPYSKQRVQVRKQTEQYVRARASKSRPLLRVC
jgi:hypothetical protein